MSGFDGHTGQQAPQCLRSRGQGEKTEEIVVYFLESMSDQEESECVCAHARVRAYMHVYLCECVTLAMHCFSSVNLFTIKEESQT